MDLNLQKMVSRGKIVRNPDEPCFDCGKEVDSLDYFMCGNGEWQGHCLDCLEIIQNGTPEAYREILKKRYQGE